MLDSTIECKPNDAWDTFLKHRMIIGKWSTVMQSKCNIYFMDYSEQSQWYQPFTSSIIFFVKYKLLHIWEGCQNIYLTD